MLKSVSQKQATPIQAVKDNANERRKEEFHFELSMRLGVGVMAQERKDCR
jgi:hypothetical protein